MEKDHFELIETAPIIKQKIYEFTPEKMLTLVEKIQELDGDTDSVISDLLEDN